MADVDVDLSGCNVIEFRRRRNQYKEPNTQARKELIFPPPNFTTYQLDMRRKAEILQYNPSSKNAVTKTSLYASAVKRNRPVLKNLITDCSTNGIVYQPTSASNVPGPIMNLFLDPTVDLYYFKTNTTNSGLALQNDNTFPLQLVCNSDVVFNNNTSNTLFSLFINRTIDSQTKNITFTTPYAIYVQGIIPTPLSNNISLNDNSLNITNATTTVYYGGAQVNIATTTTLSNTFFSYDIYLDTQDSEYVFYYYSGIMTVTIPNLLTYAGYIYDIKTQFSIDFATSDNINYYGNIDPTYFNVLCNLSTEYLYSSQNTAINNNIYIPSYQPFQIFF